MQPARTILMLEDEAPRLVRFKAMLTSSDLEITLHHWRTAPDFIAGYRSYIESNPGPPSLLCLDHDLFVEHDDDPEPGDGRDVAEFLATLTPCCRVLIHSSNLHASQSMLFTLGDSGWDVDRIAPIGVDWIESHWWPETRKLLEKFE